MAGMKWQIRSGACQMIAPLRRLAAALELRHGMVDVVHRDRSDADQPIGRHAAVFEKPIVVGAEAGFLQAGVMQAEEPSMSVG